MGTIKSLLLILAVHFFLIKVSVAQSDDSKNISIVKKENVSANNAETTSDKQNLEKFKSGILVMQTPNGIVYKSHLRDYKNVRVELVDRDGSLLYEYMNPMKRSIDYIVTLGNIPNGEYVLRLEYENRLVICDIHVTDKPN